jgi:fatty acyl-CoA reductase
MKAESNSVADIVPVDIPINVMISVAWYTAVARPHQVLVYHTTTGTLNPLTWKEMGMLLLVVRLQKKLNKNWGFV